MDWRSRANLLERPVLGGAVRGKFVFELGLRTKAAFKPEGLEVFPRQRSVRFHSTFTHLSGDLEGKFGKLLISLHRD
jgi:hypothetical protein